ncbi:hypothetical protein DITRI_Ditri04bG0029600 [Diplodiscus trichospermus]
MKDLSFLLKNSIRAEMKKGLRNSCNADGSTSTLNQHLADHGGGAITSSDLVTPPFIVASNTNSTTQSPPTTLEKMILRLELEEKLARKAKVNKYYSEIGASRMSCVNDTDILRSARNALNQYPRFSVDGKDAMYRSSFRNSDMGRRKSVCCDHGLRERYCKIELESCRLAKSTCLPSTLGGESVTWCKPGVVAKLMGLDSMPVPVSSSKDNKQKLGYLMNRQNLRRRAERHEMERRLAMDTNSNCDDFRRAMMGSCSKTGKYCLMKPVVVNPANGDSGGWPTRRFSLHYGT